MKVSFIDGPSLANMLQKLMNSSTELDIAMAYVKVSGLKILLKNVDAFLGKGASLNIVFGLSSRQGITDKESAESLLRLSKRGNVDVRKFNHSGFHPKLFIFKGDHPSIVVGSANLTEAAQSTNAEANILIEDADHQLLRDVLEFFEYYFNLAPKLKRKDVESYRPRKPRRDRDYVGPKEDNLPSPPQRRDELENMRPNKIWVIAPGKNARHWDEWVNVIDDDGNGIVAMGWDIVDLRNFKSHDSLKEVVKQKAEDWDRDSPRKTKRGYVANQLWTFKTAISKGDAFIVYSESRVLGIAEVIEEPRYHYKENQSIPYEHQIDVKYRWYKEWPKRADDKIVETLGKQGTLRPVKEDWLWSYLLEKLP